MWHLLRTADSDSNPWFAHDRREQRRLLATALGFLGAMLTGLGLLVDALATA